eukprot:TRINITY_DN17739_c0_g1_i2.p1 TRINITY_DN17739_c0_g1~~TRINITY_DN17739_c0_g1_i2.p1  ORF type:complete len:221 (-),score=43.10 TRINITY_DN17739_c0_g1_i2:575-1237(-)
MSPLGKFSQLEVAAMFTKARKSNMNLIQYVSRSIPAAQGKLSSFVNVIRQLNTITIAGGINMKTINAPELAYHLSQMMMTPSVQSSFYPIVAPSTQSNLDSFITMLKGLETTSDGVLRSVSALAPVLHRLRHFALETTPLAACSPQDAVTIVMVDDCHGREFEHVIVIGVTPPAKTNPAMVPLPLVGARDMADQLYRDEQYRRAYLALSRARQSALLTIV